MKKILAIVLSLVLVLSFSSCGCSKKDKDKNDDKIKTEQNDNKQNKSEKVKDIVVNETSDTKEKAEEIFENHKDKEAHSANMHNLFKVLNIVDIKDTTMKVDVYGTDLTYRIINNEKKFDVSPVAFAKVSAAVFAIHPEIQRITYEMKYLGENYNYYYFNSITDVAIVLNNDYYNAQTLAKARESEKNLKTFLTELDKIKVPSAPSIEETIKKCTDYGPKAENTFKKYDSHFVKHSFVLSKEADLPLGATNLYFINDNIFGGHKGEEVELIEINAKQSNIETPVKMHFLFCKDELLYFANIDGFEDLALRTLALGLTDQIIDEYNHRTEHNHEH